MGLPLRKYWALLARYLRPQRGAVALMGSFLLGSVGLQLLNPQILRGFLDAAQAGASQDALVRAAGVFLLVALAQQGLGLLAAYWSESVAWTATNALRDDLVTHCLRLDMGWHKSRTPGEMIERIDGDVSTLSNFFSKLVVDVLGNTVLLSGILVVLLREDLRVGLALAAFALVALIALVLVRGLAVPHWRRVREESAGYFGFVGESLAAAEDLRANGATAFVHDGMLSRWRAWYPAQRKAGLAGAMMWGTSLGVFSLGDAAAFGLSAVLFANGQITLGTAYLIFYYTSLLARPIEAIRTQLQDLQQADASIARVTELLATRSSLEDAGALELPTGALAVELAGASFAYQDGETVLEDVSFRLEPGRVLGLLGRSGSGKTTVSRLLFRLHDATAGEVRLGGIRVRDLSLASLRSRVGIVTQDVQLFHASVRDNLTLFDDTVPDARLLAAVDEVGLGGWLRALPDGLDTELAGGSGLSAGEAQLLAFARLFLRDPGIVILDEASSRLDPATEARIERAVDRLLAGRTGIVIAHRLATVERADDVLVLDGGHVLEHGARQALAADPGSRFARLVRSGLEGVLA